MYLYWDQDLNSNNHYTPLYSSDNSLVYTTHGNTHCKVKTFTGSGYLVIYVTAKVGITIGDIAPLYPMTIEVDGKDINVIYDQYPEFTWQGNSGMIITGVKYKCVIPYKQSVNLYFVERGNDNLEDNGWKFSLYYCNYQ